MPVEVATYIDDLDANNPPGTDLVREGDNHIRLIKQVLKNSFPNVGGVVKFPVGVVKTANFGPGEGDDRNVFLIDTTAGTVTVTLPVLDLDNVGWECTLIKTNGGVNPYMIVPPAGTMRSGEMGGLSSSRRCIPGAATRVWWTGTGFVATRAVNVPVGTVLDCPRAVLPTGYEWASGAALPSGGANYPDYVLAVGTTLWDRRGRGAFGRTDMGGVNNPIITSGGSGINGTALLAVGGTESVVLGQANLPIVDQTFTGSGPLTGTAAKAFLYNESVPVGGVTGPGTAIKTMAIGDVAVNLSVPTGTVSRINPGAQSAVPNMPPATITNFIVVVE